MQYQLRTPDEIKSGVVAAMEAAGVLVERGSPAEVLQNFLVQFIGLEESRRVALTNQFVPATASGGALDALGALWGVIRRDFTPHRYVVITESNPAIGEIYQYGTLQLVVSSLDPLIVDETTSPRVPPLILESILESVTGLADAVVSEVLPGSFSQSDDDFRKIVTVASGAVQTFTRDNYLLATETIAQELNLSVVNIRVNNAEESLLNRDKIGQFSRSLKDYLDTLEPDDPTSVWLSSQPNYNIWKLNEYPPQAGVVQIAAITPSGYLPVTSGDALVNRLSPHVPITDYPQYKRGLQSTELDISISVLALDRAPGAIAQQKVLTILAEVKSHCLQFMYSKGFGVNPSIDPNDGSHHRLGLDFVPQHLSGYILERMPSLYKLTISPGIVQLNWHEWAYIRSLTITFDTHIND